MSRSLTFYPCVINSDGIIKPLLYKNNGVPAEVFYRSAGFIDYEHEITHSYPEIKKDRLKKEHQSYFCSSINPNHTCCFIIPMDVIYQKAVHDRGFRCGYVPIEQLMIYNDIEDVYEKKEYTHWNLDEPISAKTVAEMSQDDRNQYGHIAYIDQYSFGYACNVIYETISAHEFKINDDEEFCVLAKYSF